MLEELDLRYEGYEYYYYDICEYMKRYLGEIVIVFIESGGESGQGFIGVLVFVILRFIRFIVIIGILLDDFFWYRGYDLREEFGEYY